MRFIQTLLWTALSLSSLVAGPITVNAVVNGKGATDIGAITLSTDGPTLKAKFEFASKALGCGLDCFYDFRWVQLVTKIDDDGTAVTEVPGILGKLAAIDPQPVDQGATEKKNKNADPFYYNSDEWESGKFGKTVIRKDSEFSMLVDAPSGQPDKRTVDFRTFLVAQDVGANRFSGKKFSVLAGFEWQFFGKGAAKDGEAKAGGEITPINDAILKEINDAMGRASVGGDFKGWEALRGQTLYLCPEPGTALLLAIGLLAGLRRLRQ